jgi:two-component system cell cycle sensor histidine kinase/response regulator CckA
MSFYQGLSRTRIQAALRAAVDRAQPYDLELEMVTAKGNHKWVRTIGQPVLENGSLVKVYGSLQDISERKKAEEALRTSEAQLRSLVDNAPHGIYRTVVQGGGRFIFVNPAMVKMLGYESAEEVLALDLENDVYNEREDRAAILKLLRSQGDYKDLELHWRKRNGKELTIRSSGRMVQTTDGTECFESIAEDVTERQFLEQQLREAQKMEAIGRLAGGISHDFNNILNVISGYSELAQDELAADHPVSNYLSQIRTAATGAANLTRQLLMFSRRQVVFPKVVDLNAVVNNTMRMLTRTIREDVSLSFTPGTPLGTVRGDVGQIEQILMNLVVNARDAMPKGGYITIETRSAELDDSQSADHEPVRPGPYVMLSVSDTGCGMDESTRSKIFEPFFTTKGPGKGTGLGLSTVYGIVKQNGGYVWVYSEPQRGATFKIYFPRLGERPDQVRESQDREITGGTESILLVEDDQAMRGLTAELLRSVGYTVLEADGPDRAIEIFQRHPVPVHLLLTDVIMPGMRGDELSVRLKAFQPELKVIFMSGYTGESLAKQATLAADFLLLEKPFSRGSLLSRVREVCNSKL